MLTLLTHLELGEVQYLRLLPQLNVTCTLNFHKVLGKYVFYICLSLLPCYDTHFLMLKDCGIFIKQTTPVLLAEVNMVVAAILKK
jgi:hypothetical protein